MRTRISSKRAGGYPPEYWQTVQHTRRGIACSLLILGSATLILWYGFIHDWAPWFFGLALPVAALFLLDLLTSPAALKDVKIAAILPYFNKSDPKVDADTFLTGRALARAFVFLEVQAMEAALEPISNFGFADDMAGDKVEWFEAERGLKTITGLLTIIRRDPDLLDEPDAVIDDLVRIEDSLQKARDLQASFCFLLRHGNTASGHEMDMRQGYF